MFRTVVTFLALSVAVAYGQFTYTYGSPATGSQQAFGYGDPPYCVFSSLDGFEVKFNMTASRFASPQNRTIYLNAKNDAYWPDPTMYPRTEVAITPDWNGIP